MDNRYLNNAKVFKAFCDENRLIILEMLQAGEKCAGELLEELKIAQPTISHHMKILVESGIVLARKEGKWTYYSFSDDGIAKAKNLLNKLTEIIENCCNEAVTEKRVKNLDIEFLYLDLTVCERCITTDDTLDKALEILSGVLDTLGYQVKVNQINITSRELAEKHRFVSSPTIRVNGVDICNEVIESECKDCGDLCGGETVDCRVFEYDGVKYEKPPVAMIVDGILKAVYGEQPNDCKPYILPENLRQFFEGKDRQGEVNYHNSADVNDKRSENEMKKMQIYEPAMCCPTGLCGVSIDPELLRISTVLDTLEKNGVKVDRYNLTSTPQAFVENAKVNERLTDEGVEALPIVVVDGKIVITKRYPSNDEFIKLLDLPKGILEGDKAENTDDASDSCCFFGGCC